MIQAHTGCSWEMVLRDGPSLKWLVAKLVRMLKKKEFADKFDGIAISGYSMSLLSPIVAYKLGKDVCVVPKDSERRNSGWLAEGKHSMRWLIIDDLICSGRTIKRVKKAVEEIDGTIVGVVLWHSDSDSMEVKLPLEKLDEFGNFVEWTYDKLPLWSEFNAQDMIEEEQKKQTC
jgi:orotate phosphoribosyltransferase-like protein